MKHKMTFKLETDDQTVKLTTDTVGLPDILTAFEDFLRGCGYQLSTGSLEFSESMRDDLASSLMLEEEVAAFLQEHSDLMNDLADNDPNKSGAV